jgi:RNA polymerase sigma-70 factor (ECF subfamily)
MAASYNQRNDRDLILACQRREPAAFEELVKRHQKSVYSLLYQLAPEWPDIGDLSQEVFIRVWRSINNLRNPVTFRSWLTKTVISLFYEELKTRPTGSKKKVFAALQGELDPAEDDCFDEELELETEDDKNVLSDNPSLIVGMAMKKLPEVLRTPVVLRELEGLNYEEIAILTKTEVGTVKSRIAKARGMLERMLSNYLNNSVDQAEVKG